MGWLVCGLCLLALLICARLGWVVWVSFIHFSHSQKDSLECSHQRGGIVGQSQTHKHFKSFTVSHLSASHRSKQLTKLYPASKGINNVAKLQNKFRMYNSITWGEGGENLKESTTNTIKDKHS